MSKEKPEVGETWEYTDKSPCEGWLRTVSAVGTGYTQDGYDTEEAGRYTFTQGQVEAGMLKRVRSAGEAAGQGTKAPSAAVKRERAIPGERWECGGEPVLFVSEDNGRWGDVLVAQGGTRFLRESVERTWTYVDSPGVPSETPVAKDDWKHVNGRFTGHMFAVPSSNGSASVYRCACGLAIREGGQWNGRGMFACADARGLSPSPVSAPAPVETRCPHDDCTTYPTGYSPKEWKLCDRHRSPSPPSPAAPERQGGKVSTSVTAGNCGRITGSGIPCDLQVGHKERECQVLPKVKPASIPFGASRSDGTHAMLSFATGAELRSFRAHLAEDRKLGEEVLSTDARHKELRDSQPKQPTEGYEPLHATKGMWNVINLRGGR